MQEIKVFSIRIMLILPIPVFMIPINLLTPEPETQRLSTLYNADVGLYMLANKVILYALTY